MRTNRRPRSTRIGVCAVRLMIAATCTQSVMGSALSADIEHGRQIYATYCANCHGVRGVPVMPGAPDFTRPETLLQPDPVLVNKVKAGKNAMPAFQGLLRDRDLFDVVAYLRLLR